MLIEVMASCSPAQWGLPCNRLRCASIGAPQRENPSSPTSNARTNESRRVLESGVRGNPPAPFGRGERPQGPTYPYTVRKYRWGKRTKFFITPSKKSIKAFLRKIRTRIKESRDLTAGELIVALNPMIRGWALYHRHAVSKAIFHAADHAIFQAIWKWARRRHQHKPRRWVKDKYFPDEGPNRWVFTGVLKDEEGQVKVVRLLAASSVRIERHTKVRAEANPYDPAWETYFEKRLDVQMETRLQGRRWLSHLWKEQNGLCPICHQKITKITGWHSHHLLWRSKGGSDGAENRVLLHPTCHQQVHRQQLHVEKPRPVTRAERKA